LAVQNVLKLQHITGKAYIVLLWKHNQTCPIKYPTQTQNFIKHVASLASVLIPLYI